MMMSDKEVYLFKKIQLAKQDGALRHEALRKVRKDAEAAKILGRISTNVRQNMLKQVYEGNLGNGGGELPKGPKAGGGCLNITTERSLREFVSRIDAALAGAVDAFDRILYAKVMLYQFFLSFGVDLDFMALFLLIMSGLNSPNIIIRLFTWYGLLSYTVAFCYMSYQVHLKFDKIPRITQNGQAETMLRWFHVVPLTRVCGFLLMYSNERGKQKADVSDLSKSVENEELNESAIKKLSHFKTMINVNMVSSITVSVPTLIISLSQCSDGGMSTNDKVTTGFALFQAITSLALSFIAMTIDGWDQKCMDVVSRAELLAQKKIAERQVREHLLRYYERIRGHLTQLCGDLQDGNTSSRQKQIEVKSEYNQMMRNYDTADPVQIEAEIVTILKTITELEKGAQNSDLDDILANALEDLRVQLRTVNKNVVEQKLYEDNPKANHLFQHLTFLLRTLKATYISGTHGPIGRKDGSMPLEDDVKKKRMEASAIALEQDILEHYQELLHMDARLADKLKKAESWYGFDVQVRANQPFF